MPENLDKAKKETGEGFTTCELAFGLIMLVIMFLASVLRVWADVSPAGEVSYDVFLRMLDAPWQYEFLPPPHIFIFVVGGMMFFSFIVIALLVGLAGLAVGLWRWRGNSHV